MGSSYIQRWEVAIEKDPRAEEQAEEEETRTKRKPIEALSSKFHNSLRLICKENFHKVLQRKAET